jgi:hypothetical protein
MMFNDVVMTMQLANKNPCDKASGDAFLEIKALDTKSFFTNTLHHGRIAWILTWNRFYD